MRARLPGWGEVVACVHRISDIQIQPETRDRNDILGLPTLPRPQFLFAQNRLNDK